MALPSSVGVVYSKALVVPAKKPRLDEFTHGSAEISFAGTKRPFAHDLIDANFCLFWVNRPIIARS